MTYYYVNRTFCDVLDELRKCYETRNFASFLGIVEELQMKGNQMEAGLSDKKDLIEMSKEWSKLKAEIKKLKKKRDKLKKPKKKKVKNVLDQIMEK